ncbi:MAG: hypothetical protein P8Y68_18980, partial [Anaerolineales bacterium]
QLYRLRRGDPVAIQVIEHSRIVHPEGSAKVLPALNQPILGEGVSPCDVMRFGGIHQHTVHIPQNCQLVHFILSYTKMWIVSFHFTAMGIKKGRSPQGVP